MRNLIENMEQRLIEKSGGLDNILFFRKMVGDDVKSLFQHASRGHKGKVMMMVGALVKTLGSIASGAGHQDVAERLIMAGDKALMKRNESRETGVGSLEESTYQPSKSKAVAKSTVQLAKDMLASADSESEFMGKMFMVLSEVEDLLLVSGPKYRKATNAISKAKMSLSEIPEVDLGLKKLGW